MSSQHLEIITHTNDDDIIHSKNTILLQCNRDYAVPVDALIGNVTGIAVAEGVEDALPPEEGF